MLRIIRASGIILTLFLFAAAGFSQGRGIIYGEVTDGNLKEPLGFANVAIVDLNIGTNTDLDGRYRLTNVPAGTHEVQFSYLGYVTETREVTVAAGEEIELNVVLRGEGTTLDEVVVMGQATGQRAAINQQLNSNTIVNVVSKERLQELPDQNAAESVGRLAGVSVYRDAGEGQQVSIRGISPRFNAITINGERLPSTDDQTRSVDLSMISSDALEGIELFKALRPDMDGDAVGGAVNFTVRKADEGWKGLLRLLGGYNDLKQDFGQFRGSGSISNRILGNKMGVILTGNYQRVNRSNEFLTSDYEFVGTSPDNGEPIIQIATLNLGDRLEDRVRYGGTVTLDYEINKNHTFLLSSNVSRLNRDDVRYRRRFRVSDNEQRFDVRRRERSTTVYSNTLSGEHHVGALTVEWRGSYSSSRQETPYSLRAQFWELAATNGSVANETDLNVVPGIYKNNLLNTSLRSMETVETLVTEDRATFQLDLQYDFKLPGKIAGYLKTGGKYREVDRGADFTEYFIRPYLNGDENPAIDFPNLFLTKTGSQILIGNFIGDYTNDQFFDGQFDILPGSPAIRDSLTSSLEGLNLDAYNELFGANLQPGDLIDYQGHLDPDKTDAFYQRYQDRFLLNNQRDLEDYDANEKIYAAYLMAEVNFGPRFMLLGGLRMEDTRQNYSSRRGSPVDLDEGGTGFLDLVDVEASQGYTEWLPMLHARYKFTKWMDLRAAVTKSLARPNFFNLVPWESVNNSEQIISRGKPDLEHVSVWNYDAFLSFYNRFGLFTIGAFYKELLNIDYVGTSAIQDGGIFQGYTLNEPANVDRVSTVHGMEFDLQANFRSLSGLWRGIVLGANLTLAQSNTFYPLFEVNTEFIPEPPFFVTTVLDTLRSGPIVGQADLIANLSLGYEIGGFSGRVTMTYQGEVLSPGNPGVGRTGSGVQRIPELDFFDDEFTRFDLAFRQRLDKQGRWTLLFNVNNLTNTPERSIQGAAQLLQEEEFFGATADFGVLYRLK